MNMISQKGLMAYKEAFPESDCFYGEPSALVIVSTEDAETDYTQPADETEARFLDRIERSKAAGRNLFFEEWPLMTYEKDGIY